MRFSAQQIVLAGVAHAVLSSATLAAEIAPKVEERVYSFNFDNPALNALVEALTINQNLIQQNLRTLGVIDVSCGSASCGPYEVTITPTFDSQGNDYGCLVNAPNIQLTGAAGTRTITAKLKVVYSLPIPPGQRATYEFSGKPILLLRTDNGAATTPGQSASPFAEMTVAYNYPGQGHGAKDILYFLLVVQNRQVLNKPFLCGVGDPRIVNN